MFHSINFIKASSSNYDETDFGSEAQQYFSVKYAERWISKRHYSLNDLVLYNNTTYFCNSAHTSGSKFNSAKFTPVYLQENRQFWNTWEDWHLIPSSRPVFASPKKKKRTVDIPGTDGYLDLSDNFQNGPIFERSEGSFEFYVDNDWESWETAKEKIMNTIHGKNMYCILEDDPGYFRVGVITVNQWKSEAKNSKIVFDYSVSPYKYYISASNEYVLWDLIRFETDVIRDIYFSEISNNEIVYQRSDLSTFTRDYYDFYGGKNNYKVIIRCSTSNNLKISISKVTKDLYGEVHTQDVVDSKALAANNNYEFDLTNEHYRFSFTGSGTITIYYREGRL